MSSRQLPIQRMGLSSIEKRMGSSCSFSATGKKKMAEENTILLPRHHCQCRGAHLVDRIGSLARAIRFQSHRRVASPRLGSPPYLRRRASFRKVVLNKKKMQNAVRVEISFSLFYRNSRSVTWVMSQNWCRGRPRCLISSITISEELSEEDSGYKTGDGGMDFSGPNCS